MHNEISHHDVFATQTTRNIGVFPTPIYGLRNLIIKSAKFFPKGFARDQIACSPKIMEGLLTNQAVKILN
jgi:hypothetical protein